MDLKGEGHGIGAEKCLASCSVQSAPATFDSSKMSQPNSGTATQSLLLSMLQRMQIAGSASSSFSTVNHQDGQQTVTAEAGGGVPHHPIPKGGQSRPGDIKDATLFHPLPVIGARNDTDRDPEDNSWISEKFGDVVPLGAGWDPTSSIHSQWRREIHLPSTQDKLLSNSQLKPGGSIITAQILGKGTSPSQPLLCPDSQQSWRRTYSREEVFGGFPDVTEQDNSLRTFAAHDNMWENTLSRKNRRRTAWKKGTLTDRIKERWRDRPSLGNFGSGKKSWAVGKDERQGKELTHLTWHGIKMKNVTDIPAKEEELTFQSSTIEWRHKAPPTQSEESIEGSQMRASSGTQRPYLEQAREQLQEPIPDVSSDNVSKPMKALHNANHMSQVYSNRKRDHPSDTRHSSAPMWWGEEGMEPEGAYSRVNSGPQTAEDTNEALVNTIPLYDFHDPSLPLSPRSAMRTSALHYSESSESGETVIKKRKVGEEKRHVRFAEEPVFLPDHPFDSYATEHLEQPSVYSWILALKGKTKQKPKH
ncbi:hypothetical protein GJAV_G00167180 [Gymnothorax javanicus]|nr:hypothetical protein GJAV_G00167180 [Gymnothorax javanicus]